MADLHNHLNSKRSVARTVSITLAAVFAFGMSGTAFAAETSPTKADAASQPSAEVQQSAQAKAEKATTSDRAAAETQEQAFIDYVKTSRGWIIGDVTLVRV
jgi:hypothetical protein